ncbi:hypothetical protein LTS18_001702 [Coniosporium uncinatum]|uniref:Uncharacterized protein n=1 Tax=Coniosporium uncinatum TaxID=93489 RepID=A0ACC3DEJ0_9PEZI|nr:hypothetical protein LTS18_001702 [Coniosporium uncinatum]
MDRSMEVDQAPTTPKVSADDDKMEVDEQAIKDDDKKDVIEGEKEETPSAESTRKKVEKEKVGYELGNMSRVLPAQLKYVSFPEDRYKPVKKPTGGVILLTDEKPSEDKSLLELKMKKPQPAPTTGGGRTMTDVVNDVFGGANARGSQQQQQQQQQTTGAAEAAGVLTAVDEDEEGGEEAEPPRDFDYYTDNEGGDDE